MNWFTVSSWSRARIGTLLVLLIVVLHPFFGPRLPSVLLLAMGVWLLWRQRAALFVVRAQRRLATVWGLLLLPILASVPRSFDPNASLQIAGALILFWFAGIAAVHSLQGDAERAWLAKWVAIVLAVWVVDGCVQYLFGTDLFGVEIGPDRRVIGPFDGHLFMPVLLVVLLPLAIWVTLQRSTVLGLAAFALGSVVAMLSGARTVIVYVAALSVGVYRKIPHWRWKSPVTALIVALLVLALSLSPALQTRLPRFADLQDIRFETLDRILTQRLTIWDTASNMLRDRPLTGVGAGAFAAAYDRYSTRPDDMFRGGAVKVHHAHQLYVAMAAETGLTGLLALFAVFGLCVRWYWLASPARRDQAWPYGFGLLVYAFPLNTQPPLFNLWLFPVLLLLMAGLLASLDEPPADAESGNRLSSGGR